MKKFEGIIMHDIGWKLLSVVIAAALWFMVINIEHPVDTRSYVQTIKLENEDKLQDQGLTIRGKADLDNLKITVKVKAQRTALDRLSQYKTNIKASIDLQKAVGYKSGDVITLPVDIKLPEAAGNNFEIVSKTPQVVEFGVENLVSRRIKVEPILTGNVSNGFLFKAVSVTPEAVTVTGPASLVAKVSQVRADVSLEGLSASSDISVTPVAYNEQGTVVEGVNISQSQVSVHLSVNQSQTVSLEGGVTGIPASGYTVGQITITPKTVELQGSGESLKYLTEIQLPDVDVFDATRSITKTFALRQLLPTGVTAKEGTPTNIQVRVEIKQDGLGKLNIPTSSIAGGSVLPSGLSYTFDSDSLLIDVQGMSPTDEVQIQSIMANADFSSISDEGHYTLKVNVILPPGLTLVGTQPTVGVTVTADTPVEPEKPEESEPSEPLPTPPEQNEDEIVNPDEQTEQNDDVQQ